MEKRNRQKWIYPVVILAVALAVRLFLLFVIPSHSLQHDESDYEDIALSLLQGKGFVTAEGVPTALRPPLYPAFLALIHLVSGHSHAAVQAIQGVLLALTCVLVYLLGTEIYDKRVGLLGGLTAAFYPMLIYPALEFLSEALFIFLFTLALFAVFRSRDTDRWSVGAGLFLALAALTKPLALFSFPFFLVWIGRQGYETRWKTVSLFMLTFIFCLLPWTLRNYAVFGAFIPVTTGGGIAFYNSYILAPQGLGFNSLEHLPPEFFSMKSEVAQSSYLFRQALVYIVENPLKAACLTLFKALFFFYPFDGYWYPISLGSKYNFFWGLVFCFSLCGLFHTGDRKGKELLLLVLLSILLGSVIFTGIPRYRLVLEPIFILLAAGGFLWMRERWHSLSYAVILLNVLVWMLFRFFDPVALFKWSTWSNFF